MGRYFFDLPHEADSHGVELRDGKAVGRYALRYAAEVIRDLDVDVHRQQYWRMDVREEDGAALFSVVLELMPVRFGAGDYVPAPAAHAAVPFDAGQRRRA